MRILIDDDALATAQASVQVARDRVNKADNDNEYRQAIGEYLHALQAYRTLVTQRYNL